MIKIKGKSEDTKIDVREEREDRSSECPEAHSHEHHTLDTGTN